MQALRRRLGTSGPILTVAAACASGNYALAEGRKWLDLVCYADTHDLVGIPALEAWLFELRRRSL